MSADIRINGAPELIARLKELGKQGCRRALRKSTRQGARVLLLAARAKAAEHRRTGEYYRGIKLKSRQKGTEVSTICRAAAQHAAILEKGTKERHWKTGKSTGKGPALNIMHEVAASQGQSAVGVTIEVLKTAIEAEAMGHAVSS